MDRFADRRFDDGWRLTTRDPLADIPFRLRNEILPPAAFDDVAPSLYRWIADGRGRLLLWRRVAGPDLLRLGAGAQGLSWRNALDHADRRQLMEAAAQDAPAPRTVRLQLAEEEERRRWRIRMRRTRGADGATLFVGTAEDVEAAQQALDAAVAESREDYRWSVALSPQVPWTASPDGLIEQAGPLFTALTGLRYEDVLGAGWVQAVHPEDAPRVMALWADCLSSGAPLDIQYRIRLRKGEYRWMRARAAPRRDDEGRVVRWYGTLEDVHDRHETERELAESEERFRLAVQSARLGIWDFDTATGKRSWSAELRTMLGVSPDAEPTVELALSLVHPDDRDRLRVMLQGVATGAVPPHFEDMLRIHRATDGALRWIRSTGWTMRCDADRSTRIVVTFFDVTEEQVSEERIRWAATHDAMTRLPNRALWQEKLDAMADAAKVSGESFALLLLDIDDLKRTNDSLGHDAGDALLCAFAKRLADAAPPDAVIGRPGGRSLHRAARRNWRPGAAP